MTRALSPSEYGNEKDCPGETVKPAPFAYAKARSLDHAIEMLGHVGDDGRVLAGGQSLMATLNMRLSAPNLLVDINGLTGLAGISRNNGQVQIGALTRHVAAEHSDLVARHAPLIAKAMPHIGHYAIRNRGTIGGSIAFADPAAELPACMVALGAELDIRGPDGKRTIPADEFFRGLFETAIGPRDILTAIRIPTATAQTRIGFAEFARRHGDYAMVGLAASARDENLSDLRLVYFGVGATPIRARAAEQALTSGNITDAITALQSDLDPSDDVQTTGAVKKHLAGVLLERVVKQLLEPLP